MALDGTLKNATLLHPLHWAGTGSTRAGCSKPNLTWPLTLPGMGKAKLFWAAIVSASPLSINNFILV